MEANKKLELLTEIVDEFNLSVNEVVLYWKESGRLSLDGLTALPQAVFSEKYKTSEDILPGMYVYADGLIYPEVIEGRQIKAIVGYVEGKTVYAVCLKEVLLPWSGAWRWCHDYEQDGVTAGEAFLPSVDVLEKLYANKVAISASLKMLGAPLLKKPVWSSTEFGVFNAWKFSMNHGTRYWTERHNVSYVRPVLALKLL